MSRHRRLNAKAFEALVEQMATASALCSDDQILDLADTLHDALRRRRMSKFDQREVAHEWAISIN